MSQNSVTADNKTQMSYGMAGRKMDSDETLIRRGISIKTGDQRKITLAISWEVSCVSGKTV